MDGFHFGQFTGVGNNGEATFAKGTAYARFYTRSVLHAFKSNEAGAPVFESADFVEIITPGERDTVDREVQGHDKQRWRQEWLAYQDGREQSPDGTPLAIIFPANPEIVDALRVSRFYTVEQLAEATDHAMQNMPMGGTEFRTRAKKFVDMQAGGARFAKIEKALEDLAFQNKQLEEQLAAARAETGPKKPK